MTAAQEMQMCFTCLREDTLLSVHDILLTCTARPAQADWLRALAPPCGRLFQCRCCRLLHECLNAGRLVLRNLHRATFIRDRSLRAGGGGATRRRCLGHLDRDLDGARLDATFARGRDVTVIPHYLAPLIVVRNLVQGEAYLVLAAHERAAKKIVYQPLY